MKVKINGLKIRLHRIIPQVMVIGLFIYLFGWLALLTGVVILLFEFVPYGKFDISINPWYKKYHLEKESRELCEQLCEQFPDLQKHTCTDCGKDVLTIDVFPPDDELAQLNTTGVWVEHDEAPSFILCDECAYELYNKGKLGYTSSGDAFYI